MADVKLSISVIIYAEEFSVIFNAQKDLKVYCFLHGDKAAFVNKPELWIGDKPIDYVSNWSHLGSILHAEQDDSYIIILRREKW